MLMEQATSEKVGVQGREKHLNTREELFQRQHAAIDELNAVSQKIPSEAKELYTIAETRANTIIKEKEDLAMRTRAVV
jgi:hypothetical protein